MLINYQSQQMAAITTPSAAPCLHKTIWSQPPALLPQAPSPQQLHHAHGRAQVSPSRAGCTVQQGPGKHKATQPSGRSQDESLLLPRLTPLKQLQHHGTEKEQNLIEQPLPTV